MEGLIALGRCEGMDLAEKGCMGGVIGVEARKESSAGWVARLAQGDRRE